MCEAGKAAEHRGEQGGQSPPEGAAPVRVALVAPTSAMRAGLRAWLSADARLTIVGESPLPAIARLPFSQADVIVVLWDAPVWELLSNLSQAVEPLPAVLLLSDNRQAGRYLARMPLRAWGILPTEVAPAQLLAAVHALAQGLAVALPAELGRLWAGVSSKAEGDSLVVEPLVEPLTEREVEVLEWVARGYTNRQIAATLGISEHTVKFHVSAIFAKLGVASRTEAARAGIQRGLVMV